MQRLYSARSVGWVDGRKPNEPNRIDPVGCVLLAPARASILPSFLDRNR
ncbi:MAG: hypothetical protein KME17_21760 [Cyanosarcina radialis HA8281-LM2]|nr:hypothetical protein [Cyanosarcina radialis HA8281-LM2]